MVQHGAKIAYIYILFCFLLDHIDISVFKYNFVFKTPIVLKTLCVLAKRVFLIQDYQTIVRRYKPN